MYYLSTVIYKSYSLKFLAKLAILFIVAGLYFFIAPSFAFAEDVFTITPASEPFLHQSTGGNNKAVFVFTAGNNYRVGTFGIKFNNSSSGDFEIQARIWDYTTKTEIASSTNSYNSLTDVPQHPADPEVREFAFGNVSLVSGTKYIVGLEFPISGTTAVNFWGDNTGSSSLFFGCFTSNWTACQSENTYSVYGYLNTDTGFVDTSTRIDSFIPLNNVIVSTTSPVSYTSVGYVNSNDYEYSNTYLKTTIRKYSPEALPVVAGMFDRYFPLITGLIPGANSLLGLTNLGSYEYVDTVYLPLAGAFNEGSSTPKILEVGTYIMSQKILKEQSGLFGFLSDDIILTSTSSQFVVGYKTKADFIGLGISNALISGSDVASTTIDHLNDTCNPFKFSSFDIFWCVRLVFVPMPADLQRTISGPLMAVLERPPMGYVVRLSEIFTASTTASSTLASMPVISYTTASTSMFGVATFDFDPFGELADSDSPLTYVSDRAVPKTFMDITTEILNIVIYSALIFMILRKILNIAYDDFNEQVDMGASVYTAYAGYDNKNKKHKYARAVYHGMNKGDTGAHRGSLRYFNKHKK